MTVYIEYAFMENLIFDGVLLCLSLVAAKAKPVWWRLLLSAFCGAVFAVVYPFLRLSAPLGLILKIAVGLLLCFLAFGQIKTKKEWGRYALSAVLFFALSFGYGGALLAITKGFFAGKVPSIVVFVGFAVLVGITLLLVRKLYEKRAINAFLYPCKILCNQRRVGVLGFLDSGNTATKNGLPVCFVSPDVFYDLCGNEIVFASNKEGGQVCDEMKIVTMAGEKRVPLYKAGLEIKTPAGIHTKKEVYFALAANMISREYKVLLNARILEG